MKKLETNVSFQINGIHENLQRLEAYILKLEKRIVDFEDKTKSNLIRIKNNEYVDDGFINESQPYNDLSPLTSKKLLSNKEFNYILLDVSESSYFPKIKFDNVLKVTLEQLYTKLPGELIKTIPIFIISEDGTRSVLACELLNSLGYYNVNNISGGYQYWPKSKKNKKVA